MAKKKAVEKKSVESNEVTYVLSRDKAPVYPVVMSASTRKALKRWMSEIGKIGGAATKGISTPAKRKASKANGKLGGRPRKDSK